MPQCGSNDSKKLFFFFQSDFKAYVKEFKERSEADNKFSISLLDILEKSFNKGHR